MAVGHLTLWRLCLALRIFLHWIVEALSRDTRLHRARFAKTHEVGSVLHPAPPANSLLLGIRAGDFVAVSPTRTRVELGNMLICAPTRGGKGLLAVSELLTWRHSVIVNDIKGDLFTQTAGYRATLGPVFVIDPQGTGHRFDPLHGNQTEDAFYSSASHLLFQPNEGDGAIFTQRAALMLTQLFLAARMERIAPFPYVRHLLRLGLADTAARLNSLNPDLATQFLDVKFTSANFDDRFLISSWGTLTARMRPLLTETVIRSLTNTSFTPEEIMCSRMPITVYLRWPEQDLLALSPLVRLLWSSIIYELITTYDQKQGRGCNPVLIIADEAGRTAIPMLADQATTVVGRRVYLWVAVQDLSQLETVYGRSRAQTLKNNMETQIYYRPNDDKTAENLERRLGRVSEYAHSQTARNGTKISQGFSEQGVSLMTAQEIMELRDEDIIAFHRNLPPMRLTRMDWRGNPNLRQRRAISPPRLSPLPPLTDWQIRNTDPLTSDNLIDPDEIH